MADSMPRKLDKRRTEAARKRQAAGVERLDDAFGIPPALRSLKGLVFTTPTRTQLDCPPVRDETERARHRRRKAARAARRRNRGR
jgi:hypothetical protein